MHELGIVFYVVDAVEKVAEDNGADRVVECTLELGEVSSVITSYFLDLWNWEIRKHEKLKDCKINIVPLKAISFCEDCERLMRPYSTEKYVRTAVQKGRISSPEERSI